MSKLNPKHPKPMWSTGYSVRLGSGRLRLCSITELGVWAHNVLWVSSQGWCEDTVGWGSTVELLWGNAGYQQINCLLLHLWLLASCLKLCSSSCCFHPNVLTHHIGSCVLNIQKRGLQWNVGIASGAGSVDVEDVSCTCRYDRDIAKYFR